MTALQFAFDKNLEHMIQHLTIPIYHLIVSTQQQDHQQTDDEEKQRDQWIREKTWSIEEIDQIYSESQQSAVRNASNYQELCYKRMNEQRSLPEILKHTIFCYVLLMTKESNKSISLEKYEDDLLDTYLQLDHPLTEEKRIKKLREATKDQYRELCEFALDQVSKQFEINPYVFYLNEVEEHQALQSSIEQQRLVSKGIEMAIKFMCHHQFESMVGKLSNLQYQKQEPVVISPPPAAVVAPQIPVHELKTFAKQVSDVLASQSEQIKLLNQSLQTMTLLLQKTVEETKQASLKQYNDSLIEARRQADLREKHELSVEDLLYKGNKMLKEICDKNPLVPPAPASGES